MVVLIILLIIAILTVAIVESVTACEIGSPIPDKDVFDYLDRIKDENIRLERKWNDKFKLQISGYDAKHRYNPNIIQTQYSLLFPYYIEDVGTIPVWSKSYSRIKSMFEEHISSSIYTSSKRDKLGLK